MVILLVIVVPISRILGTLEDVVLELIICLTTPFHVCLISELLSEKRFYRISYWSVSSTLAYFVILKLSKIIIILN